MSSVTWCVTCSRRHVTLNTSWQTWHDASCHPLRDAPLVLTRRDISRISRVRHAVCVGILSQSSTTECYLSCSFDWVNSTITNHMLQYACWSPLWRMNMSSLDRMSVLTFRGNDWMQSDNPSLNELLKRNPCYDFSDAPRLPHHALPPIKN